MTSLKRKVCLKCKIGKTVDCFYIIGKYKNRFSCYCKKCTIKKSSDRYQENKTEIKKYLKKYREDNKEKIVKAVRKYAKTHEKKIRKYKRDYNRERMKSDHNFKILLTMRGRINKAIVKQKAFKKIRLIELLGCSIIEARKYLEDQFAPGMNWSNHGEWHIDHIKPCDSFDLTDTEQQRKCFHFTNLQPLWAFDNWSKGSKIL